MSFEARRAGMKAGNPSTHAAPSALKSILFQLSTASRPWLLNDGPSDLNTTPSDADIRLHRVRYLIASRHVIYSVITSYERRKSIDTEAFLNKNAHDFTLTASGCPEATLYVLNRSPSNEHFSSPAHQHWRRDVFPAGHLFHHRRPNDSE